LRKKTIAYTVALALTVLIAGSLFIPLGYASQGVWRLLSPTEVPSVPQFPHAIIHGIYTLDGSTGSIHSNPLAWAVGDEGFIFYWDGFSWKQGGPSPSQCELNSINFGGPLIPSDSGFSGVGSSSPGWLVGGKGPGTGFGGTCTHATAAYNTGGSGGWTTYDNGLTGTANGYLSSVYPVTGSSLQEAWAVGSDDGTHGAFWHWQGIPGAGGAWTEDSAVVANAQGRINGVYMTKLGTIGSNNVAVDGWAVGAGGIVYRTTGVTNGWTIFGAPLGTDLNAVAMSSTTSGWAVGNGGKLFYYNGATWNPCVGACFTGPTKDLLSIVLTSSSEGWAVGKADATGPIVLHGVNLNSVPQWSQVSQGNLPVGSIDLYSVTFAISGGSIWTTGKGGLMALCPSGCTTTSNWGATTSPTTAELTSVFMTGTNDGWAVGKTILSQATIFRWDGATWTRANGGTANDFYGVGLTSSSEGWAVGGAGAVPVTSHFSGGIWTNVIPVGCACTLTGLHMISSSNGWAVGTGGNILHLTSSGGPWTGLGAVAVDSGLTPVDLYSVSFDPGNSNNGWAVGGNGPGGLGTTNAEVFHTTDAGAHWPILLENPGGVPVGTILRSIFVLDSTHIWVVGTSPPATTPDTILFYNGVTWALQTPGGILNAPLDLRGVFFDSSSDGWAVGTDNVGTPILVHSDGVGWSVDPATNSMTTPYSGTLDSLFLTSSTNGLAVGTKVVTAGSLGLAFHLDPPGLYGGGGGTTVTSVVTTTTSPSSSTTTPTSTATSVASTSTATSSSTTTVVSTSLVTTTVVSTPTTTSTSESSSTSSTSSVSTPMTLPAIPGFPWESIIAGIILGMTALALVRRHRK
jgi:hypothetical protein